MALNLKFCHKGSLHFLDEMKWVLKMQNNSGEKWKLSDSLPIVTLRLYKALKTFLKL